MPLKHVVAALLVLACAPLLAGSALAARYCDANLVESSTVTSQGALTNGMKIGGRWFYTIQVDASLSGVLRRHVLLHECGHVKHGPDEQKADCYALRAGGASPALQKEIAARFGVARLRQFLSSCGGGPVIAASKKPQAGGRRAAFGRKPAP